MMSFGIGCYLFGNSTIIDVKEMIQTLNRMIKTKKPQSEILAHLRETIRFGTLKWYGIN